MSSIPELGGRYRLLDRIGGGGMSVVWRAYDQVLGRSVAVKVLASDTIGAAGRELIRTEARTAAQLSHPHICQVYDYVETETESGDHLAYIVMELLSGATLAERLRAGRMPLPVALRVGAQVASALAAAHGCGLVHRDIKPANVMMTPTGPKVVDFGIAATTGASDQLGSEGEVWGTPAYLAPERWSDGKVTPASDVYALGIVLYRMVSGAVPWRFETVTEMLKAHQYREPAPLPPVEGLPDTVADLCRRCLAKEPHERPTAHELARVLGEAVGWRVAWAGGRLIEGDEDAPDAEAVAAQPETALAAPDGAHGDPEPALDPVRRYRRRLVLLAVVLAVAVAGVAGGILTASGPATRYGSDAAAAPSGPSAGSPATHPEGGRPSLVDASPAGGPDPAGPDPAGPDPAGGGEPGDQPGGDGTGSGDPDDPDPPPPPAPGPGATQPPDEPEPGVTEEVVDTPGGTVLARCARSTASVEPLDLAPGYRVVEETRGPGVVRAGIVLGSSEDRVRVDVRCRAGQPTSTVEVE